MNKAEIAMKLVVEWRRMKTLCHHRDGCEQCPYGKHRVCDLMSTDAMIDHIADVFQEYLSNKTLDIL